MTIEVNPFILLEGTAREAISFYQESLGANLMFMQTVGEGPLEAGNPLSDEEKARIAHSVLRIGETTMFVADLEPGQTRQTGNGLNLCISTSDADTSGQLYNVLKEGGTVDIELGPAYFSPAYGMVTDKFGVTFQIFTKRQQ
ncbi:VOC family protein [Paenibacillus sp. FSL R7-0331]|uniref:VOC family protein n=1 Tax=Paenibacillus sp. FSL R7-0331 TaxID=1536773 RepID=UPI0004F7AFC0|nr:VOC family protein [Paenibacillus sp. FSL R7-0331]AIQ50302.1 3-demethylubiquinone-9 3-methyltransferase [Paenibacillus sp. FSL R7-0331]